MNNKTEKVKLMNNKMDNFFNQHSLGNKVGKEDIAIQTKCFGVDARVDQNQEAMKIWKETKKS